MVDYINISTECTRCEAPTIDHYNHELAVYGETERRCLNGHFIGYSVSDSSILKSRVDGGRRKRQRDIKKFIGSS